MATGNYTRSIVICMARRVAKIRRNIESGLEENISKR